MGRNRRRVGCSLVVAVLVSLMALVWFLCWLFVEFLCFGTSWVLAGIAIDEPAPAAGSAGIDEMVFDLGMQRLRQPGMNWYSMKLATNNPDEEHWTYKKFVEHGDEINFRLWQPSKPENINNLPAGYYVRLRKSMAHRPDLIRRFIDAGSAADLDTACVDQIRPAPFFLSFSGSAP